MSESNDTETVPIFAIFYKGDHLVFKLSKDTNIYHLYGILDIYLTLLKEKMYNEVKNVE